MREVNLQARCGDKFWPQWRQLPNPFRVSCAGLHLTGTNNRVVGLRSDSNDRLDYLQGPTIEQTKKFLFPQDVGLHRRPQKGSLEISENKVEVGSWTQIS